MATTEEADAKHIHTLERVLANVTTNENGCWIWMAARTQGGYGALWLDGEAKYAHRVVGVIFLDLDEKSWPLCPARLRHPAVLQPQPPPTGQPPGEHGRRCGQGPHEQEAQACRCA